MAEKIEVHALRLRAFMNVMVNFTINWLETTAIVLGGEETIGRACTYRRSQSVRPALNRPARELSLSNCSARNPDGGGSAHYFARSPFIHNYEQIVCAASLRLIRSELLGDRE